MSKPLKLTLYTAGAVLALALLAGVIMLLSWRGHAKPRLQAAASDALGMDVKIDGPLVLHFFPSPAVTVEQVHIRGHGAELVAATQARLDIELVSLLRRQVRIPRIELRHVTLTVERSRDGRFNFGGSSPGPSAILDIQSTDVALIDLSFVYTNRQQGTSVQAGPCDVEASDLRITATKGADLMKNLSFSAQVSCGQIKTRVLPMTDVKFSAQCAKGLLETKNAVLRAFGGHGTATVRAEFTGAVPAYRLHGVLSKFQLDEFSKNLSQKKFGEGLMDFSTDLKMSGDDAEAMIASSEGEASLHGHDLKLEVGDLDDELAHYKSTQRFNLVDLGAFLLAGPIGLAVTKGIDYAKVISSEGGSSEVPTFISEWHVEHGVAQARDVAMSTKANRVALNGNLDFVNHDFQDVTVAVLNSQGCATVEQKVHGPFSNPDVEKPNVLISLAGPALHLIRKATHALGGGHCQVFYSGSLPPPQ
ncbi:MAG: AsmA family protein [Steroidobacterales bacterium]